MDEQSKAALAEIVAKQPVELSESEVAILRARRSYLTEAEASKFAEFLTETKTEEVTDEGKKGKKTKTEEVTE